MARLLPLAQLDYGELYAYIARRSPAGADRWDAEFEAALRRIEENPFADGLAPENSLFAYELRQIFFGTPKGLRYRGVFFVDGDRIYIVRLRGPGQRPLRRRDLRID